VATDTFFSATVDSFSISTRSSTVNRGSFSRIVRTATMRWVKELGPALDQVKVAVGRRVKGAGIEGANAHGDRSQKILAAEGEGRLRHWLSRPLGWRC